MLGTTDRALNGLSSTCARAREEDGGGLVYYIGVYSYWGPVLLGPCLVCLPGPLFEEGVADLPIDMLLLEAVLIRLVYLAVEVLKAGSLAKSKELVVDEAVLDVVELVDVIHNCLTLVLHKMLDKGISADGNPKSNVAVNYKGCGRKQGTEVREGGSFALL